MVAGTGHFVKIYTRELSIMQAYTEVFHIPKNARSEALPNARSEALPEAERFTRNIADMAEVLRGGRAITAWLLDVAACARANDPSLEAYCGLVGESGKRRWTARVAIDDAVAVDVVSATLFARTLSRRFAEKIEP
jgi:6-phosphogluconate dehydrogenase